MSAAIISPSNTGDAFELCTLALRWHRSFSEEEAVLSPDLANDGASANEPPEDAPLSGRGATMIESAAEALAVGSASSIGFSRRPAGARVEEALDTRLEAPGCGVGSGRRAA